MQNWIHIEKFICINAGSRRRRRRRRRGRRKGYGN